MEVVSFTENAYKKLLEIKSKNEEYNTLYISVFGGGCNGFQYDISFESEEDEEGFIKTTFKDLPVYICQVSAQMLQGTIIDIIDNPFKMEFVFKNPNASSGCGCGKSFGY